MGGGVRLARTINLLVDRAADQFRVRGKLVAVFSGREQAVGGLAFQLGECWLVVVAHVRLPDEFEPRFRAKPPVFRNEAGFQVVLRFVLVFFLHGCKVVIGWDLRAVHPPIRQHVHPPRQLVYPVQRLLVGARLDPINLVVAAHDALRAGGDPRHEGLHVQLHVGFDRHVLHVGPCIVAVGLPVVVEVVFQRGQNPLLRHRAHLSLHKKRGERRVLPANVLEVPAVPRILPQQRPRSQILASLVEMEHIANQRSVHPRVFGVPRQTHRSVRGHRHHRVVQSRWACASIPVVISVALRAVALGAVLEGETLPPD
mmetsp:Transcript_19889/g.50159  ORF Transcript_19889/g.50159 Transcript_19889/m.50159 type:complete len:313 (+) Transcript_19889:1961-2899(+)